MVFQVSLRDYIYFCMYHIHVQKTGQNLVQLEYTTATAVPQQDGSVFCTYETLTNGMTGWAYGNVNYLFFCQYNYTIYFSKQAWNFHRSTIENTMERSTNMLME